ncbi:putative phosphatase [Peptoniphilus sp. ING2-D1G]|nr:putative phosphatase [Peptoniphilus sp. ING2-D1G]
MAEIKSIVFDFDGTLHDTMKIYYPAFTSGIEILRECGYAKNFEANEENIKKFLGEKPDYAYNLIAKDAPSDLVEKVMHHVGTTMEHNMETVGELYPHTEEVLEKLYGDYDLYILSNCRIRYLEKALDIYEIRKYFKDYFTGEAFKYIPKEDILRQERKNMKQEILFVGDRYHDIRAAVNNEIPSVFVKYGFGPESEGREANYKIDLLEELIDILL